MPLDLATFRNTPELARETCRRRFKDPAIVDEIVRLDTAHVQANDALRRMREKKNQLNELVKQKNIAGLGNTDEVKALRAEATQLAEPLKQGAQEVQQLQQELNKAISSVGNIVHDSVPVSKDERDNAVVVEWGEFKQTGKEKHHHELLYMIGGYAPQQGSAIAGHRGYFLTGPGVLLNQALQSYGLKFLMDRGYELLQPPFFMNKDVMAETAQLEEFDEALYKVTESATADTPGEEQKGKIGGKKGGKTVEAEKDKYLIATSEQPISAFHRKESIAKDKLPIKYAGLSTCFRKEAGAHGKDAWGIFRVHQFEKIEQFVLTAPEKSWEMHDIMIQVAQEYMQSLGLPYHVVNIVSGELNNAAAKKLDLEAWFPALGVFRELVSCSNCTDYQARAMKTSYGFDQGAPFVHMLNATLCATTRTICCILENYQTDDGVIVPEALRPYMHGIEKFPFVQEPLVTQGHREAQRQQARDQSKDGKQGKPADKGQNKSKGQDKGKGNKTQTAKPSKPTAATATESPAGPALHVEKLAAYKERADAQARTIAQLTARITEIERRLRK